MQKMKIDQLSVSKYNVRKAAFDMTDIVDTIKSVGILQPLVVRPMKKKKKYEVVIGQRRFLAAKQAKLKEVPVIVKKMTDQEAIEASLIENIQKEDLDPIDRANAIKALIDIEKKKGKSMRSAMPDIAKKIGMKEPTIWENLSLLGLSKEVKEKVSKKKISTHVAARLKAIPKKKQLEVAEEIEGLPRAKALKVIEEVKAEPEKPVEEVKEKVEKMEEYTFRITFSGKTYKALEEATKTLGLGDINDAVKVIVVDWLANQGFLKSKKEEKLKEKKATAKKKGEKLKYTPEGLVEETEEEIETWKKI